LKRYFVPEYADILAYCLMPNHYHLIVKVNSNDFSQKVMCPLGISYTKAINKQEERNGHVFQGPFQLRCVNSDGDLLNLSRYIHNNPVEAGLVNKPSKWEFSSYLDYVGLRKGQIPKTGFILSHFRDFKAYQRFCEGEMEGTISDDLFFD
jgi:putative transposase